jgi:outer membrane protein assembly factor BamB
LRAAGHLYGLDTGRLVCVDAATGRKKWADGDFGNGQLVLAGDKIVVTSEKGKVALVAADPAEFRELGTAAVFDARTWNVPAVAGPFLFLRNHREIACLKLP